MFLAYAVKHTILAIQITLFFRDFFFYLAVIGCSFKGRHLCSKNK